MACGDVLSLEDLQTAKKHQIFEAEVITGKVGGVAGGASIDYATNQVTGQTQKTLPAVLRDTGFRPASFTFATGGTLVVGDSDVVVLWPISSGGDGQYYLWKGAYPKVIPASSSPATTGGVSDSGWLPWGDITLRSELASAMGAGLIGVQSGGTLQAKIDQLDVLIASNQVILASSYATPNTPTVSQHVELQQAWDLAASQGKVFVVDGVFWVLPTTKTYGDGLVRPVALQAPNNSRAVWLPGASIKAIASALPLAYIINFYLAENFELWNPVVYGDVDTHTGTTDESYHCFNIVNCKDGYVHKPVAYDAWGDGLYVGTEYSGLTNKQLENVTIFEPYAKHCGRNCISISSGKNVNVVRPTVIDAFRTAPKAGVDIEPEGVGACLPVLDGVHVVGNITVEDCYYGLGVYTFDALQGVAKVTVGGVVAKNCFQPLQALNFAQNAGAITVGDVHVDTCDISPIGIKWSQYKLHLKIGDIYAHNACSGVATTERYKSLIAVDIDATTQPAANIGLFEVGDLHITNSGVNNVLCPFYFKDNTAAANRVLDIAKVGKIYGATINNYFYADGKVTKNFKFEQVYESSYYLTPRRPVLYSEVRITASGSDFEIRMGSDYETSLKVVKTDLTSSPIKVYPKSGGTFYPLSNGGAGYLRTTVPGSSMKLEFNASGPHFFQTDITGTWTAV